MFTSDQYKLKVVDAKDVCIYVPGMGGGGVGKWSKVVEEIRSNFRIPGDTCAP